MHNLLLSLSPNIFLYIYIYIHQIKNTLAPIWQCCQDYVVHRHSLYQRAVLTFLIAFFYNQLHREYRKHPPHVPGAVLHIHCVHDHQKPGAGEGTPAQGSAACRWHSKRCPLVCKVHRERCSAHSSLWAHKYLGEGQ